MVNLIFRPIFSVSSTKRCPPPKEGVITTNWIDAWKRHSKFGFALKIDVPSIYKSYTISLDFRGHNSFNIQTWNLKFWNFYNSNKLVVLHNKGFSDDLEDRFSKLVVVEGLDSQTYRKSF